MRVGRSGSRATIRPDRSTNMAFAETGINRVTSVRRTGTRFCTTKVRDYCHTDLGSSVWPGHISYIGAKQHCGHPGEGVAAALLAISVEPTDGTSAPPCSGRSP